FPDDLQAPEFSAYLRRYDPALRSKLKAGVYRYFGFRQSLTEGRDCVIAYEQNSSFENVGINVMFSDGDVEWLSPSEWRAMKTRLPVSDGGTRTMVEAQRSRERSPLNSASVPRLFVHHVSKK